MSFSPRHLMYLLFRRRRVFSGTLLVSLALYVVLVLPRKSQYESTASIVVKVVDQDAAMPERLSEQQQAFSNMATQVINSVQAIITSQDVLENTLRRVGVETVYPDLNAAAAKARVPPSQLGAELLVSDISVKVNNDTNVLTLSLFSADPKVARNALQALLASTITKHASVMRDPRLQFLERKLASLKTEADAAARAVFEFKQRTRINSFDEERSLLLKQRDTTQASRNGIQADLFASDGRAKSLSDSLDHTPRAIAISDENDRMQRQIDSARERLTSASTRLEAAKQRFREGNPELIDQAAQLESARADFERLNGQSNSRVRTGANPVSQALTQNFSTARSDATALRAALEERDKQLEAIDARLAYLNTNEVAVRDLERRRDATEREYRTYLERAQSARIVGDMNDAGISSLSVLQSPTLPYKTARPAKLLLFLLALFAGLAGGVALCIFMESLDDTIALPEQVEAMVGLPLLCVVNQQGSGGDS